MSIFHNNRYHNGHYDIWRCHSLRSGSIRIVHGKDSHVGHLKGKVALVTGGSRGLGAAIAEALADQGANVAISYVASADKAKAVVEKLKAKGVRALAIQSDQADTAAAKPLVDDVMAHFGKLDILVNNAAIAVQGRTVDDPDLDTVNLDRQWQINVMGTVATHAPQRRCCRMAAGSSSSAPCSAAASRSPASPTMREPRRLSQDMRGASPAILADATSRSTSFSPASCRPTWRQRWRDKLPEEVMDLHPIRRIATLEEVSAIVCFLAGPNGGYITGRVVDVAGGVQSLSIKNPGRKGYRFRMRVIEGREMTVKGRLADFPRDHHSQKAFQVPLGPSAKPTPQRGFRLRS